MTARASIRLPRQPRTKRGKELRATSSLLARSLAAMGSDASRNTSIATEHARHTIHVLVKAPVASNSIPETMAPTVPPTISSEVMVSVTLPRSAMPNCLDAAMVGVGDVVLRKRYSQVADDERLEQAHAVDENGVARGHDHKAGGHHEPAGEEPTLLRHTVPFLNKRVARLGATGGQRYSPKRRRHKPRRQGEARHR